MKNIITKKEIAIHAQCTKVAHVYFYCMFHRSGGAKDLLVRTRAKCCRFDATAPLSNVRAQFGKISTSIVPFELRRSCT